jgi:hypothetical protein
MNCPHCSSTHIIRLQRASTPFNFIEVPGEIVSQVLLCQFRYKPTFRDIAEFFCGDLSLRMKQRAIGKSVLLQCVPSS